MFKPVYFLPILLFLSVYGAASPLEDEMKRLKGQRDAAVAAATKAQDEHYRTELEKVYQRAVATKDPAADAIKTELLTLGPLRELPPLGSAMAAPANNNNLPQSLVGNWSIIDASKWKAVYVLKADGTCDRLPGSAQTPDKAGTWTKNGNKLEVRWGGGNPQTFDLPVKAGKLEGSNPDGTKLWASKER